SGRRPGPRQLRGIAGAAVATGGAQQRIEHRVLRERDHASGVAERGQHLALERIPGPAHPGRPRRHSHSTGPDSAYSTAAASSTRGGSSTSAISTTSATTIATNGTRSARGPCPLPLKLE